MKYGGSEGISSGSFLMESKNFPTFLGRFSYSYSENSKYNKRTGTSLELNRVGENSDEKEKSSRSIST
jgi:hypothetical protein